LPEGPEIMKNRLKEKKMKKILVLAAVLILGIAMVSFAGGEQEDSGMETVKIGLAMNQMDAVVFHAFADYLEVAVNDEAKKRGYNVKFSFINANGDVTKQANDIKDLISKGVKSFSVQLSTRKRFFRVLQKSIMQINTS
jgi:ABC-type sugar transport system substrate-binding protein